MLASNTMEEEREEEEKSYAGDNVPTSWQVWK
jgi:hypothetical protein